MRLEGTSLRDQREGPDEEGDLLPHRADLRTEDGGGSLILTRVLRKFHPEKRCSNKRCY